MRGSRVAALVLWLVCSWLLGSPAGVLAEGGQGGSFTPPDAPPFSPGAPVDFLPASPPGDEAFFPVPDSLFGPPHPGPFRDHPPHLPEQAEGRPPGPGEPKEPPFEEPPRVHSHQFSTLSIAGTSSAQDPAENPVVGLIGQIEVNRFSGEATSQIPLAVPPGRGLTPQVALRYSSNGGQGPYGRGWRLELGRVERSTRRGVPRYNDTDHFVLLLPGGAVRVELVEKVTETGTGRLRWVPQADEAFLRVIQNEAANTWEVWDKGGTKFVFGEANARVGQDPGSASGTFGWYLTRIEDPNGNTLEITYMAVTGETAGSYVYPAQINYGANPGANFPNHKHHVVFTWELRPDLVENGTGGYLSRISRRLQKIEISTDGVNAGLAFQRYEFGYIPSPNSSQSLLDNIRRSGVDLDTLPPPLVSLPTVSLTYRGESLVPTPFKFFDGDAYAWKGLAVSGWELSGWICRGDYVWCVDSTQTADITVRKTIDLNGDGLSDYVDTKDWNDQTNRNWQVYLNNGQGFNPAISWPAPDRQIQKAVKGDGLVSTNRDTFDLNGDGKPDYVVCEGLSWQVYWNRGNGFDSTPTPWTAARSHCRIHNGSTENTYQDTFDINGDGKPGHIYAQDWRSDNQNTQKWKVYLNQYPTANGFGSEILFPVPCKQDPCGQYEVLKRIRHGAGALFNTFDLNGDGLPDLVDVLSGGDWQIYLNDGTQIRYRATWSPPLNAIRNRISEGQSNYVWDTFDINGDGLPDLVDGRGWTSNNPYWTVYLGTGDMDRGFDATGRSCEGPLPPHSLWSGEG